MGPRRLDPKWRTLEFWRQTHRWQTAACATNIIQSLRKRIGATPGRHPNRTIVTRIHDVNQVFRAFGTETRTHSLKAVSRIPGLDARMQQRRRWITLGMNSKVAHHLAIGRNRAHDALGSDLALEVDPGGGNETLDIDFVRVEQQPNQ
jgi:hypothetical protein